MLIFYDTTAATFGAPEAEESLRRREFPSDAFWFAHRWHEVYFGWTRSPRPADVVVVEGVAGREFPHELRRKADDVFLGWQRAPLATDAETADGVHKREFPDRIDRNLGLEYLGWQRGPLSTDFVEPQEPIHSREYPRDKWWFEPRRDQSIETWLQSPRPADNEMAFGKIVEPLAGCGSNLWRAYKRHIEAQFTWTQGPVKEPPPVAGDQIIRGEFPVDAWWYTPRQNVFGQPGWTAQPQTSHWCDAGAVILFTSANWGGALQFFFEAYFRAFVAIGRARLFNKTDNVEVAGSEVTTTSPVMVRVRSGAITLLEGREYQPQMAAETPSSATAIESTRIIGV